MRDGLEDNAEKQAALRSWVPWSRKENTLWVDTKNVQLYVDEFW